ncbi:hypothetical protein MTR67_012815 [Solanum verrucosum]|uniref:Integrase zinc-binding domain-containing protein n=1 Tax=Solanum verrucosum TaxID=315347 RepID=A0AAF0QC03_SOLVR|nr:hypothetical protein MTR67_012815 [Solanum verrucosum]
MSFLYHPSKANMVEDALSRLSMGRVAHVEEDKNELVHDVHILARLDVRLVDFDEGGVIIHNSSEFSFVGDGVLRYQGRLYVPNINDLREKFLPEAHSSRYFIHLGATKMYREFREVYWLNGMKKDIVEFVAKCPNCQQVKVEHQKPRGLFQDISITTWICEDLNMDFIVGLPSIQ